MEVLLNGKLATNKKGVVMRYFFVVCLLVVTAMSAQAAQQETSVKEAQAILLGNDSKQIGEAKFHEGMNGVLVHVKLAGLKPGAHAVHFHSIGNCSDHEHFAAAAGHITSSPELLHGVLNWKDSHEGDLPNIFAAADGTAEADFFTTALRIAGGEGKPVLLDEDGSALVIHAGADDYKSQPSGGTGDRIACGVVETPK